MEARSLDNNVVLVGSVDGLLFNQDRFAVTSGRMADPARADEVMVTQNAAASLGLHLGTGGPRRDLVGLRFGARAAHRAQGRRHRPAEPGGGAGPDRQIPHVHRGDAGADKIGGRRRQHRVPRGAAAPRRGRRGGRGATVELDRAVLHRLPGLVAAPGRSQSVDTARGPGPRRVRRRRRTGRAAPRHPTRRTPAEPARARPRRHARGGGRPSHDRPRRPRRHLRVDPRWEPSSPWGWRWRCPFSSRSGPSGPSTRIVA